MNQIYTILTLLLIISLCSCNTEIAELREENELYQDSVKKIISLVQEQNRYNSFISKIETDLTKNYIDWYGINSEMNFSDTFDFSVGKHQLKMKIFKNEHVINEGDEYDIVKDRADYLYEIIRYKKGSPLVFAEGTFMNSFSDGEPSGVNLLSRTFYTTDDTGLNLYYYKNHYSYNWGEHFCCGYVPYNAPEWSYMLKYERYEWNEHNVLQTVNREIYIEDYSIVYAVTGQDIEVTKNFDFSNTGKAYIDKVEEIYKSNFVPEAKLKETILLLMLNDEFWLHNDK